MSIRVRLTLAFSAAMIVLVASGALVLYHQLRVAIDHPLNDGLRTNLGTIAALVAQADTGLRDARLLGPGDGFAQVIDARGGIFDETAGLDGRPLISASRLAGVRRSGSRPLRVTRCFTADGCASWRGPYGRKIRTS